MSGRVFDGRIARGIAPDDRARQDRLKATARSLVTAVRAGLVRDGVVRLHGFGTFRLRRVAARRGRHPRTGEPIDIPAGWRVMFRPAKALRERVEPDRAPSLPIGEPHASREAMLAASAAAAARATGPGAGRVPAAGIAVPPPAEPERVAAATMPESKFSVQGPLPHGSADLEADSCVTRSPAALTRSSAANEPPPAQAPAAGERSEIPAGAVAKARPPRYGYRSVLLVLLVLLLAGLAWLFRPADAPAPPVAGESGTETPARAPAGQESGAQGAATTAETGAPEDQAIAEADTEPTTGQSDTDPTGAGQGDVGEGAASATEPQSGATTSTSTPEDRDVSVPSAGDAPTAAAPDAAPTDTGGTAASPDESGAETVATGAADAEVEVPRPAVGPTPTADGGTVAALTRAAGEAGSTSPESTTASVEDGAEPVPPEAGGSAIPEREVSTGEATDASAGRDATGSGESARTTTGADAAEPYFAGRNYTVRAGDTLWDLADRHYVNPYYWPHIWNHNGGIENPDRLEVRQGLWLPSLEGDPRSLTEADRRSIAEGYLRLYRFFRAQGDANPQYALVGVRYFDASVLPERLRGTAAGHPGDTLAAAFQARLEAEFPLD